MGDRRSSLSNAIQLGIDSALKELHTCLPAEVISFNAAEQTADLQISIKRKIGSELVLLPVLKSVPIRYQRSSTYSITFPLEVGDHVMVIFCERSIDTWLEQGGIKEPSDIRKHDLSDAFATPMMYPKPDVIPDFNSDDLEIKTNSGNAKIIVKASGEVHIETDSDTKITSGSLIAIEAPTITATATALIELDAPMINMKTAAYNVTDQAGGDTTSTMKGGATITGGAITHNGKDVGDTHKHGGVTTGTGNTGNPV